MGYYAIKTPKLLKAYYPNIFWNFSKLKQNIYLTFDDGPTPEITTWVLDCLAKQNVKATFFCIGKNMVKHPDIVKEIVSRGHALGNHTFGHENGWKTKTEDYLESIIKTESVIESVNASEKKPLKLFRPPYGRITKKQIKAIKNMGYQIIMWDVLSGDFDLKLTGLDCERNVVKSTENGSVIVFHDSLKAKERLQESLPKIIVTLKEKGFQFKKLDPTSIRE